MKLAHTPGPWIARWSLKDGTPCGEFVTGSVAVVRAGHVNSRERPGVAQYVTNPADAALIASAPELLVALERCAALLGRYPKHDDAWAQARAVIAKATGDQA